MAFLTQNLVPMLLIQLLKHYYRSKFAIPYDQYSYSFWQKTFHIVQQCPLCFRQAVSFDMVNPCPGNGNSSFPICYTDNQQLVREFYFSGIHNQLNLLNIFRLLFQPTVGNRFIPLTNIYACVAQNLLNRLVQLRSLAESGIFPAIRLRFTERLW